MRALRARGEARPGWGGFGPSKASAYTSNNYITPRLVTLFTEVTLLQSSDAGRGGVTFVYDRIGNGEGAPEIRTR